MDRDENLNEKKINLQAINERLKGKTGPAYWRGMEEIAETPEFEQWVEDEFPNRKDLLQMDRRSLLKFMGASLALAGLSGCRSVFLPAEKLIPYVRQPEEMLIGKPLYYATAMPLMGYAAGVLVEQREGRPIKLEGNPEHPMNGEPVVTEPGMPAYQFKTGALDHQTMAQILNFYDPDRSSIVQNAGNYSTWDEYLQVAKDMLAAQKAKAGAGLRILTGTVASPSQAAWIQKLLKQYPQAKWHVYEPVDGDNERLATMAATGQQLQVHYNLTGVKTIVSLDSDFLLRRPDSLRLARQFADGRRVVGKVGSMNRLYTIESSLTITGATADHRWPVKPSDVFQVAAAIATQLGVPGAPSPVSAPIPAATVASIVADLQANKGAAVVIPGEMQSPELHQLCLAINAAIGANGKAVTFTLPVDYNPAPRLTSIKELSSDLDQGVVDALLVFGGNPAYDAPAELDFASKMAKAKFKAHHTMDVNETSQACDWITPMTHPLEEWGDLRSVDGTVSIIQPLIQPLYDDSRSVPQYFAALLGQPDDLYDVVRSEYPKVSSEEWRVYLNAGLIKGTELPKVTPTISLAGLKAPTAAGTGIEVSFLPCGKVGDGRYANNGWLRELPDQITKLTWDNIIQISPAMAVREQIEAGNILELSYKGASISGPVLIQPGQPDYSITLNLGYGRKSGGVVATEEDSNGYNAYPLRTSGTMGFIASNEGGVEIHNSGGSYRFANVQIHNSMQGRDIIKTSTLASYLKDGPEAFRFPDESADEDARQDNLQNSMIPDQVFDWDGPSWGMTIDLNLCTGCNACVTACQAENNISVVGKDQVARGREMHWIRIDRYYGGFGYNDPVGVHDTEADWDDSSLVTELTNPKVVFQPVMCLMCEKAPCEPVCPVAATVHSHDGLNQMVYNRCIGTRYCSDNCPYKVRKFNFLNYQFHQPNYTGTDRIKLLKLLNNPDVTVRSRGVMEKCTYCIQRILSGTIEDKLAGVHVPDGQIITACQQACPTKAITFGNIRDKKAYVSTLREDPRSYLLLEDLNTRPHTSHLARLRNTNPEITA